MILSIETSNPLASGPKRPRYNAEQWQAKCVQVCSDKSYTFLGFVGDFMGSATSCKVFCNEHSHEWTTSVRSLCRGFGCSVCSVLERAAARTIPDDVMRERFKSTGVFAEGTTFRKTEKRGNYGQIIWDVHCPVCAVDEYCEAGLCTGIFESAPGDLVRGIRSCRCSTHYHKTPEQLEYMIRSECEKRGYKFIRWVAKCSNVRESEFEFYCPLHEHNTVRTVAYFMQLPFGCEVCTGTSGFCRALPGHLYVLRTTCNSFAGFGVSNNITRRLARHRCELQKHNTEISEVVYFEMMGNIAAKIEREIQAAFPLNPQPITGFKTEATHAHLYDDVVSFVQSRLAAIFEASKEDRCEALK